MITKGFGPNSPIVTAGLASELIEVIQRVLKSKKGVSRGKIEDKKIRFLIRSKIIEINKHQIDNNLLQEVKKRFEIREFPLARTRVKLTKEPSKKASKSLEPSIKAKIIKR